MKNRRIANWCVMRSTIANSYCRKSIQKIMWPFQPVCASAGRQNCRPRMGPDGCIKSGMRRLRSHLPQLLLAIGVLFWGQAIWIYAKAQLAQVLIAHAWSESLAAPDVQHKPWRWADTWPVLRLRWRDGNGKPNDLFVLAGVSGSALAFGPGLLDGFTTDGTLMKVIAAHRDTHFAFLEHARIGDAIQLQNSAGEWREYIVAEMSVADASTSSLYVDPALDALMLITCYPFNALNPGGSLRYLVKAYPAAGQPG